MKKDTNLKLKDLLASQNEHIRNVAKTLVEEHKLEDSVVLQEYDYNSSMMGYDSGFKIYHKDDLISHHSYSTCKNCGYQYTTEGDDSVKCPNCG